MEIKISAELPFSWCQFCKRMDMKANRFIANGEVYETTNVCENAPICEACERARAEELRKAAAPKKSEAGQDDAAEEGEVLESLKLGAAFDAGFAQGFILARGEEEALPEAGVVWTRFCRLNNLDPDTLEPIRVIGVDMGAGADQTWGISNGEYLRRVLPGMTDETLRDIFACRVTCSDCPMEEPCRNCIDKRHRGEKVQDLTCGDRWELWLKEAVK